MKESNQNLELAKGIIVNGQIFLPRETYSPITSNLRSIIVSLFITVFLITFVCFIPDLKNDLLIWDDAAYIIENINIHTLSVETVTWAFSSYYLNYWAPLTWLSLAFDYAVWGTNPLGYHLTNNILHALNAGIFFLISLKILEIRDLTVSLVNGDAALQSVSRQLFCAILAALFFAVHPLRVESVVWATERKDVLSLFFGLPAVLFYLRHSLSTRVVSRDYWLSLVFFSLSLLSKSLMITLPVVLLILDWFPHKRLSSPNLRRVLLEKAPFFLLSGITAIVTISSQAQAIEPIHVYTRILNAFRSVISYVWLTVLPLHVSPFYVHPFKISALTLEYVLSIILFVLLTLACVATVRRWPVFLSVWLIFLVTILPFLGLTQQVGPQAMAGRFTYCSGLPLALLFAVGVMTLYDRVVNSRPAFITLCIGVGIIILVNGFLTVRDISVWKNDETLWTKVVELAPGTGRAYFQRSHAYRLKRDYPRSLADIEQAITIAEAKRHSAMHDLYRARAIIYSDMGNLTHAVADFTKALESAQGGSRGFILYERGLTYQKLGMVERADNDFKQSGRDIRKSDAIPNNPENRLK